MKKDWYFLGFSIFAVCLVGLFSLEMFLETWKMFFSIIVKVFPILVLIWVIMALTKYFFKGFKNVKQRKMWIFAVVGGVISSGPVYVWYPWLKELQDQGVHNGLLATFIYARAIKIPLIPLMIAYFGIVYVILFVVFIFIFSILGGVLMQKVCKNG